jgi:GPI mannosyltransferase 3
LLLFYWGPVVTLLLVVLAALGGLRFPLLLGAALVILVSHSLVPHKEHRFIYPAILLLLIVAGLGAAQLATWFGARRRLAPRGCAIVATSFFACCALALARSPAYAELWQSGQGMVRASYLISDLAAPCGVGIYKSLSGYAYFHQHVPFYWPDDQAELVHDLPAMDTLILGPGADAPAGYRTLQCFDGTCVARRPGICEPIPMTAMPRPRAIATLAARKD